MRKGFETLLEAREALGKTQAELAEMLEISRNYVSLVELGRKPFSAKLRRKLEKVFDQDSAPRRAPEPVLEHALADMRAAVGAASDAGMAGQMQTLAFHLANLFTPGVSSWNAERAKDIIDLLRKSAGEKRP